MTNVSLILVNPPSPAGFFFGGGLGVSGSLIVNSKGTTIFWILGSVSGLLLCVWLGVIIVDHNCFFLQLFQLCPPSCALCAFFADFVLKALLFPECSCYLFQKSCPGSAAGFLLHVLLLVYNCLLYTLLGGSLAAFKKKCF